GRRPCHARLGRRGASQSRLLAPAREGNGGRAGGDVIAATYLPRPTATTRPAGTSEDRAATGHAIDVPRFDPAARSDGPPAGSDAVHGIHGPRRTTSANVPAISEDRSVTS